MDVKGQSRICGQCHKEVAMDNFALHESHCRRFLCLCPACGETVRREHLEQHRLAEHTQVNCSECNQHMERRLLTDHKLQECVARLLSCEFCELELPCSELQQHEWACGSRTQRCGVCHRYILLRDLDQHTSTCPTDGAEPRPPQAAAMAPVNSKVICIGCMGSFPAEYMEEHKLGCGLAWRRISQEEEEEEEEEEGEEEKDEDEEEEKEKEEEEEEEAGVGALKLSRGKGDLDFAHPCSYCQLVLPQVTLRWHEPKCKIHLSMK